MAVETVFLTVLVVALAIGNVLLSFIPSNGGGSSLSQKGSFEQAAVYGKKSPFQPQTRAIVPAPEKEIQAQVFLSNFSALNEKINLTNRQLEEINEKVRKLGNFRANTQVELGGMKEILLQLQNRYITVPPKKVTAGGAKEMSREEMRKMIYRSK